MTDDKKQFGRRNVMPPSDQHVPRIASSQLNYTLAGVSGVLAIFAGLAGVGEFALMCASLCFALLLWGVINNYVRKIELRLIDIQKALETK